MLTSVRQASSYRSVASAVNTRLIDLRLHGAPSLPLDELMKERIETVRDLLLVGRQFAPGPGELDTYGSSPAKLDLARELVEHVPLHGSEAVDMRAWADQAVRVLEALSAGKRWEDLGKDADFAENDLEPFLQNLLALPPREPDW